MVGFLKVTALVFLGVVILACVSTFLFFQGCSGQMSACYQAWKSPDSMKRERLGALTQFTASATAIAFPVVLDNEEAGLLFIDRKTSQSKLIYERDKFFLSPHLSADGERLVLIQRHDDLHAKKSFPAPPLLGNVRYCCGPKTTSVLQWRSMPVRSFTPPAHYLSAATVVTGICIGTSIY